MGRIGGIRRSWGEFRKTVMYALLARQRRWLVWLLLTASGALLGAVGYADTLRKLVDHGVVHRDQPISHFVGMLVFLAFFSLVFGFLLRQVISRLTYHLEFELRIWLYERLQSTDPERLDSLSTGQMVTRAMTDLLLLELVVLVVPTVAVVSLILLAIFILMLTINWWLAIVAVLVLPANLAIVVRIRRRLWGMSWVTLDRRARVTTRIDEAVRGARVVKAFGREDHEEANLETTAASAYAAGMTRIRLVSRYDMLLAAVPGVVMGLLTWLGAREGVAGHITAGDLLLFFVFALTFANFARIFGSIQSAWQFAKTGAGRIFELIAYARPAELVTGLPLPGEGPGLELRRATVRISDHPVLAPLTFTAAPGELVVVAGPPRSGKTTLARLIAGGCPVAEGSVTLDGVAIADADSTQLRRAVRIVVEDPFLFGRTVRENLLLGAPNGTTDDQLWNALDAAGARQVVEGSRPGSTPSLATGASPSPAGSGSGWLWPARWSCRPRARPGRRPLRGGPRPRDGDPAPHPTPRAAHRRGGHHAAVERGDRRRPRRGAARAVGRGPQAAPRPAASPPTVPTTCCWPASSPSCRPTATSPTPTTRRRRPTPRRRCPACSAPSGARCGRPDSCSSASRSSGWCPPG